MALDFSELQGTPAHTGSLDFSALGAVPAVGDTSADDTTALGAAGRGAVGMLPLGDQAYAGVDSLVHSKKYVTAREDLEKDIAKDKENNPGSRIAGQAAGIVAPALLTGGASAPESLAAALGEGALVGGGFGAGNAIDTVAKGGGAVDAAKDVAKGAALGAAGGGVAKSAGEILGKFFKSMPTLEQEALEGGIIHPKPSVTNAVEATAPKIAESASQLESGSPMVNAVGKALPTEKPTGVMNMAEGATGGEGPKVGTANVIPAPAGVSATPELPPNDNELRARMLTQTLGGTARQIRKLPGKDMVGTLNKMGDVFEQNNLLSPVDRYPARLQKFIALHDKAGKIIGDTVDSANIEPITIQPIMDAVAASRKFPSPLQADQLKAAMENIKRYAGPDGNITFQNLHKLKVELGKEAFEGQGDPILQSAYHVVGNAQDAALEKVGQAVNKPAFDKAKEAYQATERAIPMLKMATAKALVNKPSLTELLSGHPIAAATGLIKEPVERAANTIGFKMAGPIHDLGNAQLGAKGGAQLASAAANVGPRLNIEHPALQQWKHVFQQNAAKATNPAEVEKSHAVTDFVLSQRDPAYAQAKQKMTDATEGM